MLELAKMYILLFQTHNINISSIIINYSKQFSDFQLNFFSKLLQKIKKAGETYISAESKNSEFRFCTCFVAFFIPSNNRILTKNKFNA